MEGRGPPSFFIATKADLTQLVQDYPESPEAYCERRSLAPPRMLELGEESGAMVQAVMRKVADQVLAS